MPRNERWFRVYDRNIDSPQIMELTLTERGLLFGLWSIASANDGLIPYSAAQIRRRLGVEDSAADIATMLQKYQGLDLIESTEDGYAPCNWQELQSGYPSQTKEAQAQRQRERRQRLKSNSYSVTSVTSVTSDMSRDKSREEEIRLEESRETQIRVPTESQRMNGLIPNQTECRLHFEASGNGHCWQSFYDRYESEGWRSGNGNIITAWKNKANQWMNDPRNAKQKIGGLDATADYEMERLQLRRQAREERHERRNANEVLRSASCEIEE